MYGFKEKWHAEILKQFAENNLQNGIQSGNTIFPAGNGSRIFIVSLPDAIPAFQDGTPGRGLAEIKFLKSSPKSESDEDNGLKDSEGLEESEELAPYLYDDGDPVTWDIHNLSGHSIPETPESPKPEDLRLAIQDSFGQLYLLPEVSELFGTLAESWEPGDTEAKTITLDEGFERSDDFAPFQAYPAPTLSEGLSTGTAVTCRYVKAVAKWFFFRPSGANLPVVEINGNQLLGLGWFNGNFIFDLTLKRGFLLSGTYQVVQRRKTDVMLGNDWSEIAMRHPVATSSSSESLGFVINGNYTTSRVEITDLTDDEEEYEHTPAFTTLTWDDQFESVTVTGRTYPDGANDSYCLSGFYTSPWYGNGLNPTYLTTQYDGVNQRLFDPDSGKVCTQFGVPVAINAVITDRSHDSIDVEIGTPVYSSPNRPHCTLRVTNISSLWEGQVFFDTTETISGVTYHPDYLNQKLTAQNYEKYGEYRPTATLPNDFSTSVTLRFYYQQTDMNFVWEDWFEGTSSVTVYFDEEEEDLFIDKDKLFRWRVPTNFSSLSATYEEQNVPEGESTGTVTFTFKELLDPKNGILPKTGGDYTSIQYDERKWENTSTDAQSTTTIPASTLEPTESHPDIVLTFVEKIPPDIASRSYTWIDNEGNSQRVTLAHNRESVYLVNVEKFQ